MALYLRHKSGRLIPIPIPVKIESNDPPVIKPIVGPVGLKVVTSGLQSNSAGAGASVPSALFFGSFADNRATEGDAGAPSCVRPDGSDNSAQAQHANASLEATSTATCSNPACLNPEETSTSAASESCSAPSFGEPAQRSPVASAGASPPVSASTPAATAANNDQVGASPACEAPSDSTAGCAVGPSPAGPSGLSSLSLLASTQAAQGTAFGLLSMLAGGRAGAVAASLSPPASGPDRAGASTYGVRHSGDGGGLGAAGESAAGTGERAVSGLEVLAPGEDPAGHGAAAAVGSGAAESRASAVGDQVGLMATAAAAAAAAVVAACPGKPEQADAVVAGAAAGAADTVRALSLDAVGGAAAAAPDAPPASYAWLKAIAPLAGKSLFEPHGGVREAAGAQAAAPGADADAGTVRHAPSPAAVLVTVPPHLLPVQVQLLLRYVYGNEASADEIVREAPPPYKPLPLVAGMGRAEAEAWRGEVERAWTRKLVAMPWYRLRAAGGSAGGGSVRGGGAAGAGAGPPAEGGAAAGGQGSSAEGVGEARAAGGLTRNSSGGGGGGGTSQGQRSGSQRSTYSASSMRPSGSTQPHGGVLGPPPVPVPYAQAQAQAAGMAAYAGMSYGMAGMAPYSPGMMAGPMVAYGGVMMPMAPMSVVPYHMVHVVPQMAVTVPVYPPMPVYAASPVTHGSFVPGQAPPPVPPPRPPPYPPPWESVSGWGAKARPQAPVPPPRPPPYPPPWESKAGSGAASRSYEQGPPASASSGTAEAAAAASSAVAEAVDPGMQGADGCVYYDTSGWAAQGGEGQAEGHGGEEYGEEGYGGEG